MPALVVQAFSTGILDATTYADFNTFASNREWWGGGTPSVRVVVDWRRADLFLFPPSFPPFPSLPFFLALFLALFLAFPLFPLPDFATPPLPTPTPQRPGIRSS